jgi:hypothetical protein
MRYYVSYREYPEWLREPDPDDRWDAGEQDRQAVFSEVSVSSPNTPLYEVCNGEDLEPGTLVYVAWCRFSTGGTFGSTHGRFDVMGVFLTREEAERANLGAEEKHRDYFGGLEETFVELTELRG